MSRVVVTGGAGFIGINLADTLLSRGEDVLVFDNLSRPGVESNLHWLQRRHPGVVHVAGDVRDAKRVGHAIAGCSFVFHLAAQVAVTTSLDDPLGDHSINVGGTLNVLEAVRAAGTRPGLLFASTNKVYGALEDLRLRDTAERCMPEDEDIARHGIGEDRPLDFISPYGCSKGAADQYVLDYCHSYGLEAVVFRMSCIYGPHQQANSDQGWVTHFLRSILSGRPLTIFGDGRQVRDLLYVEDFVQAALLARSGIGALAGRAFNIGGGPANSMSLLEMVDAGEALCDRGADVSFDTARLGDQRYFTADVRRFGAATGWAPRVTPQEGVERLKSWLDGVDERITASGATGGIRWA